MITRNHREQLVKIGWLICLAAALLSACISLFAAPNAETATVRESTPASAISSSPADTEPASAPALTPAAAEYLKLVRDLCDDSMEGRGVGTKGLEKARDYITDQFKAVGLLPVFLPASQPASQAADGPYISPAEGQLSYLEPFNVLSGIKVDEASLTLSDKDGNSICQAKINKDFTILGFSGSGRIDGKAVFAGYGISDKDRKYDSYAETGEGDLKGKIVAVYRYEPQNDKGKSLWSGSGEWSPSAGMLEKYNQASRRGAAAFIIVNPPSHKSDRMLTGQQTGFGEGRIPAIQISFDLFTRILKACGMDEDNAAELQTRADEGKLAPMMLSGATIKASVRISHVSSRIANVGCVLPGEGELAKEVVVVGGHYDHIGFTEQDGKRTIYYGADDNASGASGVITLAKRFAGLKKENKLPAPRRTIVFVAFSGEEIGLIGSNYMTLHQKELGLKFDKIASMVNLDMIGRLRGNRLSIWGVDSGDLWRKMIAELTEGKNWNLSLTGSGFGPSDYASFCQEKIPALFFCTGMHLDVHRPTDRPEKINASGAIKILDLVQDTIVRLIGKDTQIAYQAPKSRSGSGQRGYLGVVPDQSLQPDQKGCPIAQVMQSGPAEEAGMKIGDVIIKLDQSEIVDANGLVDALTKCKPGQKIKITVLRGDKSVELDVTLGGGS